MHLASGMVTGLAESYILAGGMPCSNAAAKVKALKALPVERPAWLGRSTWDCLKLVPPPMATMAPVCGTMLASAASGSAGGLTPGWGKWLRMAVLAAACNRGCRVV